jgi:hypothetical protein
MMRCPTCSYPVGLKPFTHYQDTDFCSMRCCDEYKKKRVNADPEQAKFDTNPIIHGVGITSGTCEKCGWAITDPSQPCPVTPHSDHKPKGLRYDEDKPRVDLIPADVLLALGRHYMVGSKKYYDDNWRMGLSYKSTYGCLMRHLLQWWNGEDMDEETGSHHLDAVIWNAVALRYFELHPEQYRGFDNRWYLHNTHNDGTTEGEQE